MSFAVLRSPLRLRAGLLLCAAAVSSVLLTACAEEPPAPPRVLSADERAQVDAFADEFAAAVDSGDLELVERAFDLKGLTERIMEGIELQGGSRRDFMQGLEVGLKGNGPMQGVVGQPYRYLRTIELEGQDCLLFRMLPTAGGVNYHAFAYRVDEPVEVRLIDFHVYSTGEWLSESIRRLSLPAIAQLNQSFVDKILSGPDRAYVENLGRVGEMSQALMTGEFDRVLAVYDELPSALQDQKAIIGLQLSALSSLESREAEYIVALERYDALYPDEASAKMMLIDYQMLVGEFDAMLTSVDWLEQTVGGDPYCDVLRASGMVVAEDYERAQEFAQRAIERESTLEDAHWTLVTIGLGTGDHALTRKHLAVLRDDFDYLFDRESMSAEPIYADFMATAEAAEFFDSP